MICFIIYIVVFVFLSSTVEIRRWGKLDEMFVFGILSVLTAMIFMKTFMESFQE